MFMWLIIWAVPMVVMGIVALVTRSKTPSAISATQPGPATLCPHCGKYYAGSARFCPLCGGPQT
jgi:predicted amidophosphoribosyltransferase